jgi:COP9 signalosome complex subunit 5
LWICRRAVRRYYQLDVSFFKSSTDASLLALLWNKYWISTLSSSTLITNSGYLESQVRDLADKLEQAEGTLVNSRSAMYLGGSSAKGGAAKSEESQLSKICRDSSKLTRDHVQGLMSQIIKNTAFNS